MKIAFVQAGLGAGGAEKIVNILATHRAGLGDDVTVIALSGERERSYFPYNPAIRIETPAHDGNPRHLSFFRIAQRTWWLRRRLVELRPDLIVSFLTKTNVLVMLASLRLGTPVVISERNNPKKQSAHPLWLPASLMLARRATAVVMQTEAARDTLPRHLQAHAAVIPNPCVVTHNAIRTTGDGGRIVAVGRLDRQKGFDLLIEAFSRFSADARHARLIIFGEGPDRGALEALAAKLGVADRVSLPGVTPVPGTWLDAGDIFVLSSRYEGFPNVLVEALAGGLPAVAFDCPWGPSTILTDGKDGVLVPPEDVDALAQALKRLVTDRNLRNALAAAAPTAAHRFSLPSVLARWDAIMSAAAASLP